MRGTLRATLASLMRSGAYSLAVAHRSWESSVDDQVRRFEDERWRKGAQQPMWRHGAALELVEEEPILDVGGGDGLLANLLAGRGLRDVKIVDLSPIAIERAKAAGLSAQVVDITQPLPFEDQAFATVCALDVLEHLMDPLPTLRELARISRHVVIVVPNFQYWRDRARMAIGEIPFQSAPARGHVHWFNYRALRELIEAAGLVAEAQRLGGAERLGGVGNWMARAAPSLFAHSFAVRARLSSASQP